MIAGRSDDGNGLGGGGDNAFGLCYLSRIAAMVLLDLMSGCVSTLEKAIFYKAPNFGFFLVPMLHGRCRDKITNIRACAFSRSSPL